MVTANCDSHPLLNRFHKHDANMPDDQQDKRSVIGLEQADLRTWPSGTNEEAMALVKPAPVEVYMPGPPLIPAITPFLFG